MSSADKRERRAGCGRPHSLMQKTSDFLKLMVCPYGQVKLVPTGLGQFLRTSFID